VPELFRIPLRMDCKGIDLTSPLDRMPPGTFPYLFNVRVIEEGIIEPRPGYSSILSCQSGDMPNSIRRLNDPSNVWTFQGYAYVGGAGHSLYWGNESLGYKPIDTGYSGNPLSLIPFRPDQDVVSWMYVYDSLKTTKVRPDGTLRAIGVVPPVRAPVIEYGVPSWTIISDGQSSSGWSVDGSVATAITTSDRTNGTSPTIVSILYNSDTHGWACINPSISQPFWMGERMAVILNSGSGNAENVVVRDINNAITATTIQAIQYDTSNTGMCSIVLTGSPIGLARNSLIELSGELVRVLEVIPSPDGTQYSVRCSTIGPHSGGETVTGLLSWYVYTQNAHLAGEPISSSYQAVTQGGSGGAGIAQKTVAVNAATANGRPIDPANDYLHVSIFLQSPANVTNLQILLALDPTPNFSFADPGNAYLFTIPQSTLQGLGSSAGSWVEVVTPISAATRYGSDLTQTLANISGIALQLTTSSACNWGFDWWYVFGTYGPTIQPNSPTGMQYQHRFRDSSTGAHSVPGPLNRQPLFPLRESVIITPSPSNQSGIDTIDIYRLGGTITSPLYVGSAINNFSAPNTYLDTLTDLAVDEVNQPPDLTAIQPWPLLDEPWIGTCKVSGTSILLLTGHSFNVNLLGNTVILIAGQAFQLYGSPRSTAFLELTQDAGYNANASFEVASPTLYGQPLPFAFGPLEGPFAPTIFGLGDPLNGGVLYFTNFSDADGASDLNTMELATPGNNLVSGDVWKGMAFAGNREEVFCLRFAYLTTIGASNNQSFQWYKIDAPSGFWSRWSVAACPVGVAYLGRDGIYIATDGGAQNISDEALYPLFPHDGQAASSINRGTNIILPVNMAAVNDLRMSYCDEAIRFSYVDTGGNWNTLIYEIYKKRWFLNNFADDLSYNYLVEASVSSPASQEIVALDLTAGTIVLMGGNTDGAADINSLVLTPSFDGGDERSQKLYVDSMVMADGTGTVELAFAYENSQTFGPVLTFTATGQVTQFLQVIDSQGDLELHRNIACKFAWTGGPAGPRLYAWETAGYMQPYLTERLVTQFIALGFPGWKHHRRMYPALISNNPALFTILTQDGRSYGPYTIPSTGGQYRQLPQMLDQNIKDLAFSYQIDGQGNPMALFVDDWTVEVKEWQEDSYIRLAIWKA
jgi:hypothetical protein